jgi:hypothetical protein
VSIVKATRDGVVVEFEGWERLAAGTPGFTVPWEHIDRAEAVTNTWKHARGYRLTGSIPGVALLGTMRFRGGRDFAAIRGTKPGILIEVHDEPFERLVATAPHRVVEAIIHAVTHGTRPE